MCLVQADKHNGWKTTKLKKLFCFEMKNYEGFPEFRRTLTVQISSRKSEKDNVFR